MFQMIANRYFNGWTNHRHFESPHQRFLTPDWSKERKKLAAGQRSLHAIYASSDVPGERYLESNAEIEAQRLIRTVRITCTKIK